MAEVKKSTILISILVAVVLIVGAIAWVGMTAVKNINKFVDNDHDEFFKDSGDVAVLTVKGVIMTGDETLRKIEELEERSDLKAVVLRVDSPGGAVGPSQEIYEALKKLREKKKLICSFGDLAASGGYYIAAACERIFANPGTLTGSIGVIMHFMNLRELYHWAKVEPVTIKAGKYKDIGSESRPMTDEERGLLQNLIDDVHEQFKEAVAKGRNLPKSKVDAFADGRIFSGRQAKSLGFVDELGSERDAILYAAKAAGITGKPNVVREPGEKKKWRMLFDEQSQISRLAGEFLRKLGLSEAVSGFDAQVSLAQGVPYLLPAYMFENSFQASKKGR